MAYYKQSFPALWSMLVSRLAISPIKSIFIKFVNKFFDENRKEVKRLQEEYGKF